MPAQLEDPTAAVIYRTSGVPPYPSPGASEIPTSITPRQVTLRDRITIATLLPFSTATTVPPRLLSYLCQQFNLEIEKGDTYPMITSMTVSTFGTYWFQNFGAIMILGAIEGEEYVQEIWRMEEQGIKWEEYALGSFYVKPNYPGRSSHVCNAGFVVTEAARNKGVGRLMGEGYLEWAPKLGYTYSVFNLVYETNVASCRIWDALGFKRIGRIKGCGNLRSSPDALVDAIIYGRDLGPEGEDYVSEERFDKIRYYLKHGKYPNGADRAEKSRLRSAATHYKLLPPEDGREGEEDAERLMLRDKEVVSDPQRQYEIARQVHVQGQHGGINKTTATIAEKFHWVRIKETVSLVIKNCENCKDSAAKTPTQTPSQSKRAETSISGGPDPANTGIMDRLINFDNRTPLQPGKRNGHRQPPKSETTTQNSNPNPNLTSPDPSENRASNAGSTAGGVGPAPTAHMFIQELSQYSGIPLDPQIMQESSQIHRPQRQQQQVPQSQAQPFQPHPSFAASVPQATQTPHAFPDGSDPRSAFQYQNQMLPHNHPAATHANPHKIPDTTATDMTPVQAHSTNPAVSISRYGRRQQQYPSNSPLSNTPKSKNSSSNGSTARSTRSSTAQANAHGQATANQLEAPAGTHDPSSSSIDNAAVNVDVNVNMDMGIGMPINETEDDDAPFDIIDADTPMADPPAPSPDDHHQQGSDPTAQEQANDPDRGDDTRLATDRHIRMGDEPMGTRTR